MKKRVYHDAIVIAVPPSRSPIVDGVLIVDRLRVVGPELERAARRTLAALYPHATVLGINWTFATTPEQASAWPLPHDCDDCREGKYKAIASLTLDPDVVIALGDITCEEPVND